MNSKRSITVLGFILLSIGVLAAAPILLDLLGGLLLGYSLANWKWLPSEVIRVTVGGLMVIIGIRILISQGAFTKSGKSRTKKIRIDGLNLKKLAPMWVAIGIGLSIIEFVAYTYLGMVFNIAIWALAAWAVSGGIYANRVLKSDSGDFRNIALNGAIIAGASEALHQILSTLILIIQYPDAGCLPFFNVSGILQSVIMGTIGAAAWYGFKAGQVQIDHSQEVNLHTGEISNQAQGLPVQPLASVNEWAPWPVLILANATAGGVLISMLFSCQSFLITSFLGGTIGGILVGFMPWLAQRWPISKNGRRIFIIICVALVSVVLAVPSLTGAGNYSVDIFDLAFVSIPAIIASSLVAIVTRVLCQRWLKSKSHWWEWVLAGILILGITFAFLYLLIGLFAQ